MGDFDIAGSALRGVAMRRQIEETREIIADRARRTEAEQKMLALQKQLGEIGANGVLSMAKLRELQGRVQAGEEVSPEEMRRAITEQGIAITDFQAQATPLVMQMIQSAPGNEYLLESASKINGMLQENATRTAAMLETMHGMQAEDQRIAIAQMTGEAQVRASDASVAAEGVRSRVMLNQDAREAGREPFIRDELAAGADAQRAQTDAVRGREEREKGLYPFQVGTAAADLTGSTANARTATVQADRAERDNAADKVFDTMAFANRVGKAVEEMRASGQFTDDQIADKVREVGFDPGQLTMLTSAFDDEVAGELVKIDRQIAKTRDMVGKGMATNDDLDLLTRKKNRLEVYETKKKTEEARFDEMKAEGGELEAMWEKVKLVSQRRGLTAFGKILGGNPVAALPRLINYIENEDYGDLLSSGGPFSEFFGSSYQPAEPVRRPSEMPSLGEQVERTVRQEFEE